MSNRESKDMEPDYLRVCVCDCNTGRFITSMTHKEIEYIYELVVKNAIKTGDWIHDTVAEGAIEKMEDMKNHLSTKEGNEGSKHDL